MIVLYQTFKGLGHFHYSMAKQVSEWITQNVETDGQQLYGYLQLKNIASFRDISPFLAYRVIAKLIEHFTNEVYPLHLAKLQKVHNFICASPYSGNFGTKSTLADVRFLKRPYVFDRSSAAIERIFILRSPSKLFKIPIKVGQVIRWGSFDVELIPLSENMELYTDKFYVRNLTPTDEHYIPKKIKEKNTKLIKDIRFAQPIICFKRTPKQAQSGYTDIVSVPFLDYHLRTNLKATAVPKPLETLY